MKNNNMNLKHIALISLLAFQACGEAPESSREEHRAAPTINLAEELNSIVGSWTSRLSEDCFVAQEFKRDLTYTYTAHCIELTSSTSAVLRGEVEFGTFSFLDRQGTILFETKGSSCLDKPSYILRAVRNSKNSLVLWVDDNFAVSFVPVGPAVSDGTTFQLITGCYEDTGFVARPIR